MGPAKAWMPQLDPAFRIADWSGQIQDFGDTAAIIENLDLLISVDTSIIHVAGAIGADVWMLNRFDSCWRWGPAGDTSGWYPTLRIFRQDRFGAWDEPVARVASALSAFVA